ncbi:hypothetical protein BT69DRAFT_358113 [Atractiella rhizophila]|nr:hypothetical protein BT69DRAFT_358113 [Atractiella rhizophila]
MASWEFIASWFPLSLLLLITITRRLHRRFYGKAPIPPSIPPSERDSLPRWKAGLLMLALHISLLSRILALGGAFASSSHTFESLATDLVTVIYFALVLVVHLFAFPLRTPLWSALISLIVQAGIDVNLLLEQKRQGCELIAVLIAISVHGSLPLEAPRDKREEGAAREDHVTLFEWIFVS